MKQAITINLDDLRRLAAEFVKEQPPGEQLFLSTFMVWLSNKKREQSKETESHGPQSKPGNEVNPTVRVAE